MRRGFGGRVWLAAALLAGTVGGCRRASHLVLESFGRQGFWPLASFCGFNEAGTEKFCQLPRAVWRPSRRFLPRHAPTLGRSPSPPM